MWKVLVVSVVVLLLFVIQSTISINIKGDVAIKSVTTLTSTNLPTLDMEENNPLQSITVGDKLYFVLKNTLNYINDDKVKSLPFAESGEELVNLCQFIGTTKNNATLFLSAKTTKSNSCTLYKIQDEKVKLAKSGDHSLVVFDSIYLKDKLFISASENAIAKIFEVADNGFVPTITNLTYVTFPVVNGVNPDELYYLGHVYTGEQSGGLKLYKIDANGEPMLLKEQIESTEEPPGENVSNSLLFVVHDPAQSAITGAVAFDHDLTKMTYISLVGYTPSNIMKGLFNGEYYFLAQSTTGEREVLKVNGNSAVILQLYAIDSTDRERVTASQLSLQSDGAYIVVSNEKKILRYGSNSQVEQAVPTYVALQNAGITKLRVIQRVRKTLLVEYCTNEVDAFSETCQLGYITPSTKELALLPFEDNTLVSRVVAISQSDSKYLHIVVSTTTKSEILKIELNKNSDCFPACNEHSSCNADTGACDCEKSEANGYWAIDSRGLCSKCDQKYAGGDCKTLKSSIKCYGIGSDNDNVCSGHGDCSNTDVCSCYNDDERGHWTGRECNKCVNHFDSSLKCRKCAKGWQGDLCDVKQENPTYFCYGVPATDAFVCGGHGTCESNGTCVCNQNKVKGFWTGIQCQRCLNHFDFMSGCKTCFPGYEGALCDHKSVESVHHCNGIPSNSSAVCSAHGKCIGDNSCSCYHHYQGRNCEQTTCFGIKSNSDDVCSGRGLCVDFNECACKAGFTRYDCKVWNQGKGLWIMTVIMAGLTGLSVLVLLVLVGLFKLSQGEVEYHALKSHQLHDDDDNEEDLFLNEDEDFVDAQEPAVKESSSEKPTSPAAQILTGIEEEEEEEEEEESAPQEDAGKFSMGDSDEEDKL